MTSLFEEIPSKEVGENDIIGGVSLQFGKDGIDMPKKRFENLVVPIGLQFSKMNTIGGNGLYETDTENHVFMEESKFSKLFYSVAKDLGSYTGKLKNTCTKKNRR